MYVTVKPVNDAPELTVPEEPTVDEENQLSIGGGQLVYNPAPGYVGPDEFTYHLTDGEDDSAHSATVSITMTNLTSPTASSPSYSVVHDRTLFGDSVITPATDPDGDDLIFTVTAGPAHGMLFPNNDGSFVYIPTPGYTGSDGFSFTVSDGIDDDDGAVSINVTNTAPHAVSDGTFKVIKNKSLSVETSVLDNDTDPDGDALTITANTTPGHGSLSFGGAFTFTPATGYTGSDSFTYTISDGITTDVGTVSLNVVDQDVVANNDFLVLDEDASKAIDPRGNDRERNSGALTVIAVSSASHGTTGYTGGSVTYTPAANYYGPDSFTYTVENAAHEYDIGTVYVTVKPVNDAPEVTVPEEQTVDEENQLSIGGIGISDIDADDDPAYEVQVTFSVSHGTLMLQDDVASGLVGGQISGNGTGSLTVTAPLGKIATTLGATDAFLYTSAPNWIKPDTMSVSVNDLGNFGRGGALSDSDSFAILHPTTAVNDAAVTAKNTPVTLDPRVNDLDPDYDPLTVTGVTQGDNGSVTYTSGSVTYTPDTDYDGPDAFTYTISDGHGHTDTATVIVNVGDGMWATELLDATTTWDSGGQEWSALQALGKPNAVPGDDVGFAWSPDDENGGIQYLTLGFEAAAPATGFLIYESEGSGFVAGVALRDADTSSWHFLAIGADTSAPGSPFVFKLAAATDYNVDAILIAVNLDHDPDYWEEIDAVYLFAEGAFNDMHAPSASNDSESTDEDTAVEVHVLGNDTNSDGYPLRLEVTAGPAHGSVYLDNNGTVNDWNDDFFVYTPEPNYNGSDSFDYRIIDIFGASDTATVNITINPVNDDPVAYGVMAAASKSTPLTIGVLASVTDVDEDELSVTAVGTPAHGSASISGDNIIYTPTTGYIGQDSVSYTVSDGTSTATASILISVYETGQWANSVVAVSSAWDDDSENDWAASQVLGAPDTIDVGAATSWAPAEADDGEQSITVSVGTPSQATGVAIREAGGNGFVTAVILIETDDTEHTIWSDVDPTQPGAVTDLVIRFPLTTYTHAIDRIKVVIDTDHAPGEWEQIDMAAASKSTPLTIGVLDSVADVDEDELSVTAVGTPAHGSASISGDNIIYTPTTGFIGQDSVSYTVSDGNGGTATASILISIYESGQWASTIEAVSSEWDDDSVDDWAASQVLGAPDTAHYGAATSWAPAEADDGEQSITVSVGTPSQATGVAIREAGGNGFVTAVILIETDDTEHTIWSDVDPTQPGAVTDLVIRFPLTTYTHAIDRIKVVIDTDHAPGEWEQIDAIRLLTGGSPVAVSASTSTSGGVGTWTEMTPDAQGRPSVEKTYRGADLILQRDFGYDAIEGFLDQLTVTDSLGRITDETYDADGQVLTRTVGLGSAVAGTTTYVYDAGKLVSLTDANGNTTTWDYDGNTVVMTDQFELTVTKTYDSRGRLVEVIDRNDLKRTFAYDYDGHLLTETWYDTDHTTVLQTLTFTYRPRDGQITRASKTDGVTTYTYTFTYNTAGQLVQVTEPFGVSLWFGYDASGNRTLVQDSFGGRLESTYDVGQLTSRIFSYGDGPILRVTQDYDDFGRVLEQARFDDAEDLPFVGSSEFTYDDQGRLTALVHTPADDSPISYTWEFDDEGQLIQQTDHGDTYDFTYDEQGQLSGDGTNTWEFDGNGNPTSGGDMTGLDNRLPTDGVWDCTYDFEGNLIEKELIASPYTSWTYGWDNRNELIWVEKHAAHGGTLLMRVEFEYDAFGNRIEKKVDTDGDSDFDTTQRYALDGWNPAKPSPVGTENWDVWADLDGSSSLTTRYLRGDVVDQLFARIDGGEDAYWYLTDHLGSIREVMDNAGVVQDTITYDAFGNFTETHDEFGGRYKYTGREFDAETRLQYNRARYYDAAIGRWINQDPLSFDAGDSNLYRYVHNSPMAATDASGLLGFVNVLPPTVVGKGGRGGALWDIKWTINTDVKGFIVQRVTMDFISKGQHVFRQYWEAFEVTIEDGAVKVWAGYQKWGKHAGNVPIKADDRLSITAISVQFPIGGKTRGENETVAAAKFFPKQVINWPAGINGGDPFSGNLPSTKTRPDFWPTDDNFFWKQFLNRKLVYHWDDIGLGVSPAFTPRVYFDVSGDIDKN